MYACVHVCVCGGEEWGNRKGEEEEEEEEEEKEKKDREEKGRNRDSCGYPSYWSLGPWPPTPSPDSSDLFENPRLPRPWEGGVEEMGENLSHSASPAFLQSLFHILIFISSHLTVHTEIHSVSGAPIEHPGPGSLYIYIVLSACNGVLCMFSAHSFPLNLKMSPRYHFLLEAGTLPLCWHGPCPYLSSCLSWIYFSVLSPQHGAWHIIDA